MPGQGWVPLAVGADIQGVGGKAAVLGVKVSHCEGYSGGHLSYMPEVVPLFAVVVALKVLLTACLSKSCDGQGRGCWVCGVSCFLDIVIWTAGAS